MKLDYDKTQEIFVEMLEFWSKDEKLAGKKLLEHMRSSGKSSISAGEGLEFIVSLRLSAARKDVAFLCTMLLILGQSGEKVRIFRKAAMRRLKKISVEKRDVKIATKQKFQNSLLTLISKNKLPELVFLCLVLCSGRRGIDVSRLCRENITELEEGKFLARLEFDKRSTKPTVFLINLQEVQDWLVGIVNIENLNAWLRQQARGKGQIFNEKIHKNLGRFLDGFSLHSLRSVRAVWLLKEGFSEEDVKVRLGWLDDRMLLRYLRTSPEVLRGCSTLDEALLLLQDIF